MGCLCLDGDIDKWERVSLEIQNIGAYEYLIWHRYCPVCHQNWFVKIHLPESQREIFTSEYIQGQGDE